MPASYQLTAPSMANTANSTAAPINDYGSIDQPKLSVAVLPLAGLTLYGNWGKTYQIGASAPLGQGKLLAEWVKTEWSFNTERCHASSWDTSSRLIPRSTTSA